MVYPDTEGFTIIDGTVSMEGGRPVRGNEIKGVGSLHSDEIIGVIGEMPGNRMAAIIEEILTSDKKHKEKVALLTEKVKSDKRLVAELFELLKTGNDVEKGTAAEVMKFVSKDKPELMVTYTDVLIEYIDYKAPRVKWGCPESIGNLAKKYPDKVEKAIPKLFENLKDKSTVVRWCAAFALTEIAKYNSKKQKELVSNFQNLIKTEHNNGIKNVYLKTLKEIEKQ